MNNDVCYFLFLIGYNSLETKSETIIEYGSLLASTALNAVAIDCLICNEPFDIVLLKRDIKFERLSEVTLKVVSIRDKEIYKQDLKQTYPFAQFLEIGAAR
jgi:hypothetical protein